MMEKRNLKKYCSGEWVLLFNDEIVDHSANVEDILKVADEKFPEEKFPEDTVKITKIFEGTPRLNCSNK